MRTPEETSFGLISQAEKIHIFAIDLIEAKTVSISFVIFVLAGKKATCNVIYNRPYHGFRRHLDG